MTNTTPTATDSIVDDIAVEIARDLIASGESPTDFHDVANEYVRSNRMDDHLDDMTLNDQLDTFETPDFDTRNWLTDDIIARGPAAVSQILFGMQVESIRQALQTYEYEIETAIRLHHALNRLADEKYAVNHAPNYTGVVHAFFTWIGDESASGNTMYDDLGLDEFNELHVRGRTALDPTNRALFDALEHWLNAEHPAYLD